jgi:Holliday junction resolvase RusA-like endonuclease
MILALDLGVATEGGVVMTKNESIVVLDVVGRPVGKARPRVCVRGGKAMAYTPAKTAGYEQVVRGAAIEAMKGRKLLTGPIIAKIYFFFKPPKSYWDKRLGCPCIVKPDIDNLAKSILDSLNGIVYKDDSLIFQLFVTKRYADIDMAKIKIIQLIGE